MLELQKLAVIIPTLNDTTLESVIREVQSQMPVSTQIIIAGFGPARQVAEKFNLRFMDTDRRTSKPILLNRFIPQIDAGWLIILDADAIPQPGWAQAMLAAFEQGQQLFSGSVDVEKGTFWMRVYNLSMLHEFTPEKPAGYRQHLPAISLGFTRETFQQLGPFREDIQRSEDFEWTLRATRAGLRPYFIPGAMVVHEAVKKDSFRSVMQFWFKSGQDNWQVRQWYSDILQTPFWMQYPSLILIFSPVLAIYPTIRIINTSSAVLMRNLELLPFIYLTKLVWCWGVFWGQLRKEKSRD